jgi:Pilus formation protein N terminal region
MTALYVRGLVALRPLYWLAVILSVAAIASRASADPLLLVDYDQAKIIKIPDRAASIVLGNPFIADVSLQPGGIAVITGKSFGDTNMLVLDKSGAVLNEQSIRVRGPAEPTVVVYRGVSRETYSCEPDCQPRTVPGDEQTFFNNAMTELGAHNNQALAAGATGK